MTQLATPLVEVAKIEVEDGFNPRTHMDPEGLARLAASLGKTDMVQPLTVNPKATAGSSSLPGTGALRRPRSPASRRSRSTSASQATR
jgi:hypothetical protein